MITRFKVSGFKNLLDTEIQFGPFTCIAGPNGVGKSNLFDAIKFLGLLAEHNFNDAAIMVRDDGRRNLDIRSFFYSSGDYQAQEIYFEADMIIPSAGTDEWGVDARASISFVTYSLRLTYRQPEEDSLVGHVEILSESLEPIKIGDAFRRLGFPHSPKWRRSLIKGRRTVPYISTAEDGDETKIQIHQDGGSSGKPQGRPARRLTKSLLSSVTTADFPTVFLTRQEMLSWQFLMLEPSALRRPDEFKDVRKSIAANGGHLPATLYRTARLPEAPVPDVYGSISGRLLDLIQEVLEIEVDRDEKRELLTLVARSAGGATYTARSLSDGTLRFLVLAAMELDPHMTGLLALEEPENGIHPDRIPAMIRLLKDIAMDPYFGVDLENLNRQVIVNTHSPLVVSELETDDLLIAERKSYLIAGKRVQGVEFNPTPGTWRSERLPEDQSTSLTKVYSYLYAPGTSIRTTEKGDKIFLIPQTKIKEQIH